MFYADADGVAPWTVSGGASLVSTSTARGARAASGRVVTLSASGAEGKVSLLAGPGGLPVGTHLLRVAHRADTAVAGDLQVHVRNVTDSADILAATTFAPKADASLYGTIEALITIPASASGDTIEIRISKATATANTIRVDHLSVIPTDALHEAFGRVPRGGRIEHTYNGDGTVNASTIYDAQAGGSVIETIARTYGADGLASKTQSRGGRTLTTTYTYTGGNLTKKTMQVS